MTTIRPLKVWIREQYQNSIQAALVIGSAFIFMLCLATGYLIQSENCSSITKAYSTSIRSWVTSGDVFQIKKSIGQLIDSHTLDFAEVRDTQDQVILRMNPYEISSGGIGSSLHFARAGLVQLSCIRYAGSDSPGTFCFGKRLALQWFIIFGAIFISFFLLIFSLVSLQSRKLSRFLSTQLLNISEQSKNPQFEIIGKIEIQEVMDAIQELRSFYEKEKDANQKLQELDTAKRISAMASQLAHDIRSPLAVLELSSASLGSAPEQTRMMIRGAISRIKDIANTLGMKNGGHVIGQKMSLQLKCESTLLSPVVEQIISEKRLEWGNTKEFSIEFKMDRQSYGLFAFVKADELKRILSNFLNNSFESFGESDGAIVISTIASDDVIELAISDNGAGMPGNVLGRIGQKGNTYGKPLGSGLGLYHAKTVIEESGGQLIVESEEGRGTNVKMNLMRAPPPAWFLPDLRISGGTRIVVFDDDLSIHRVWEGRLSSAQAGERNLECLHISSSEIFKKFFRENFSELDETLFLIDYEIVNSAESGLDLIESFGIEQHSILVTSRYEEPQVKERCERMGVKMIPKPLSIYVPIIPLATKNKDGPHPAGAAR
jgi:signal transduction histidine kinase